MNHHEEQGSDAGLVDDVVTMTQQAAVDGLPLSAVLEDLRLVLDLEPSDDVPVHMLRRCALAWAAVQQDLVSSSSTQVATRTWHELESHLWSLVGSGDNALPGWAIEVRAGAPQTSGAGDLASVLSSVLGPADHLRGAAQVLAAFLDRPGEQVTLLREPAGQEPDRVVALVAAAPGPSADDRASLACARLAALPVGGEALVVRLHPLAGHAEGMLSALRVALGQPA